MNRGDMSKKEDKVFIMLNGYDVGIKDETPKEEREAYEALTKYYKGKTGHFIFREEKKMWL